MFWFIILYIIFEMLDSGDKYFCVFFVDFFKGFDFVDYNVIR